PPCTARSGPSHRHKRSSFNSFESLVTLAHKSKATLIARHHPYECVAKSSSLAVNRSIPMALLPPASHGPLPRRTPAFECPCVAERTPSESLAAIVHWRQTSAA